MNALPLRTSSFAFLGLAAAAGFAITAIVRPGAAASGVLVAFLFWSSISIGSIIALAIHRLTGGAWGIAHGPALSLCAGTIPLVALSAVIVFALIPALYPWAARPAVAPDVARFYLNTPLFIARSAIAFLGWIATALALARNGPRATKAAAFGLTLHCLVIGAVGLDWIQSIEPPFFSTAFGASLAVTQLAAAFAAAAVLAPGGRSGQASSDLAGLLLATILGLTYIDFMTYLIVWYGNRPHKVDWFVRRALEPWSAVAIAMFLFACVIPVFALLVASVRRSPGALRVVGTSVLLGIALYCAWLVGPAGGAASLIAAAFAIAAMGALIAGLASARLPIARRLSMEATDGS